MADYTFLGLVNELCRKVNEVAVTPSNFYTTVGFYDDAKNAVNRAIDYINLSQRYWRFNQQRMAMNLVAGQSRYDFPVNSRVIDFGSFVIKADATLGNETKKLKVFDYDEYLKKYSEDEYSLSETTRGLPDKVIKPNSAEFIVHPVPRLAYPLTYEYFASPTPLVNYDDVPTIPEKYRLAIFYGAVGEVYDFRDNDQKAERYFALRDEIIKNMRKEEINRHVYAWSNVIGY